MRLILNLIILGIQGAITFVVLVVIYMILALLDYQGGFSGFIGITLFQPILGGIVSIITIAICLIIGLPLRINHKINTWWTKRIWLSILGLFMGLTLMSLSFLPAMVETVTIPEANEVTQKEIPNLSLIIAGWFLIGFSLLHLFPPYRVRLWAEEIIANFTGERNAPV